MGGHKGRAARQEPRSPGAPGGARAGLRWLLVTSGLTRLLPRPAVTSLSCDCCPCIFLPRPRSLLTYSRCVSWPPRSYCWRWSPPPRPSPFATRTAVSPEHSRGDPWAGLGGFLERGGSGNPGWNGLGWVRRYHQPY